MCFSNDCPLFCLRPSPLTVPGCARRFPRASSLPRSRYDVAELSANPPLLPSKNATSCCTPCSDDLCSSDSLSSPIRVVNHHGWDSNNPSNASSRLRIPSAVGLLLLLLALISLPRESLGQYYEDSLPLDGQSRSGHNFGPPWSADIVIPHADYLANRRHMTGTYCLGNSICLGDAPTTASSLTISFSLTIRPKFKLHMVSQVTKIFSRSLMAG